MAQQIINYGNTANDGTGDPLRDAFIKVDENFNQIWAAGPVGSNVTILNNTIAVTNTNGNLILTPNGIGVIQTNSKILPRLDNTYDLGNSSLRYRSLSIGAGGIALTGNLTIATVDELRIPGGLNGYILQTDGNSNLSWVAYPGAGNGSPGGANTQVQFNDNGLFGGTVNFTFDKVSNRATVSSLSSGNVFTDTIAINRNSDPWIIQGNSIQAPTTARWFSDTETLDEYFNSAANGFLNFQTFDAVSNLATQLHMNHGLVRLHIHNLTELDDIEWTFQGNGDFTNPGNIITVGNISGNYIVGNGSLLTDLPGGVIQGNVPPPSPNDTTLWWDDITGRLYVWYDDGSGLQWVDAAPAGPPSSYGNSNVSLYLASGTNSGNISTTGNISGNYFIGDGSLLTGISGFTGATGASGLTGATGVTGFDGATGASGLTGATGVTGFDGATGASGLTGATGVTGLTGATGLDGATGPQGYSATIIGSVGNVNVVPPGDAQQTLNSAFPGAISGDGVIDQTSLDLWVKSGSLWVDVGQIKGDIGATGFTGASGLAGTTGFNGATGASGLTGSTGVTGFNGATGASGLTGSTGFDGATGASGLTGATGVSGFDGATGASGLTGSTGFNGATGLTGSTGPVAGADTQVVFNDAGSPNATAGFTFDKTTNTVATTGTFSATGNVVGNYFIGNANISNVTINSYTSVPQLWFKGQISSPQNVVSSTDTVSIWNNNTDPQSWGNVTTGHITPNKSGWYEIISRVEFDTNAAANSQDQINHQIRVNDNQVSISQLPNLTGNVPMSMMSTAMVEMNGSTDYITTTCWSSVAGNAQQINGGNTSLLMVRWVST